MAKVNTGKWRLREARYVRNYRVASPDEREGVNVGDVVQLEFVIPKGNPLAETARVGVVRVRGNSFKGKLIEDLFSRVLLKGSIVSFEPRHVLRVE